MFAATTSPSYSPTWVSGQMPLTSPIAQRRSPARRYLSTWIPFGSTSMPTVSRPSAGRHEQPVAPQFATVEAQDIIVALPPRGGGVHPEHQLDSVLAEGLG